MTRSRRAGRAEVPPEKESSVPPLPQPETQTSKHDVVAYLAYGAIVVLGILFCLSKLYDDDVFWQLATGRWIVQHHAIPDHDVFGFVTGGQHWFPVEWLWGVVLYALYHWTQSYGSLEILTALICSGVLGFQILTMHRLRIAPPITILVVLLVLFTALGRILPRPHIVTALALSATVFVLYRSRQPSASKSKILYLLPPIFLVWTNMHPGVLVGMMIVGLGVVSELLRIVLAHYLHHDVDTIDTTYLKKLAVTFVLCGVAVLMNPHGMETYLYVYRHAQMTFLGAIQEWESPFSPSVTMGRIWFYKIFLFVGSASLYYAFRKRDPLPALLYIAMAIYSLQAHRLRVDFAVVTATGTALALNDLATQVDWLHLRTFIVNKATTIGCAILTVGLICVVPSGSLYQKVDLENQFGLGLDSTAFPLPMLDFLRKENIRGRPFNEFGIGGILIWEEPDIKNFIDSRDLNDTILSEYISMYNMQPGFEKKFQDYGIDHAMIYIPGLQKDADLITTSPIPYFSTHRDEWKLVYWDDKSSLYVKNVPKFSSIIKRYEYKTLHPYLFAYHPQTFDSLRSVLPNEFQNELQRKLREEPNGRVVRFIAREVGLPSPTR